MLAGVIVDPNSTTHVGAEKYAVDLNLLGAADDSLPNFDKGQPIYAPMDSTVIRFDRTLGQLVLAHHLVQADGTEIIVTTVYHLGNNNPHTNSSIRDTITIAGGS